MESTVGYLSLILPIFFVVKIGVVIMIYAKNEISLVFQYKRGNNKCLEKQKRSRKILY